MKILAIGLGALSAGLLASPATFGQLQTAEPPKFRIEIQATAEGRPTFTITNLFSKTLTAGQFRFSVSSQSKAGSEMGWDAILQSGGRARHVPGSEPLDPEASMTLY